MTTALVDADIIAYRSAASAEKDSVEIACIRANRMLQDIISVTDSSSYKLFLSGSRNFRKDIYEAYKSNRDKLVRPTHLQPVREYLVLEWAASVTDGYEADDAIGIASGGDDVVICSIDKDLKQLPGVHYNFVTSTFEGVDELDGWRSFYSQLVLGDRGDNVPGYDGKMRAKWPVFLAQVKANLAAGRNAYELYRTVQEVYKGSQEELIRNGRLLYIWRVENDNWQPPTPVDITQGEKLGVDQKSESTAMMQEEPILSTVRGGTKRKNAGSKSHGPLTVSALRKKLRAASTSSSKASSSREKGKGKGNKKQ